MSTPRRIALPPKDLCTPLSSMSTSPGALASPSLLLLLLPLLLLLFQLGAAPAANRSACEAAGLASVPTSSWCAPPSWQTQVHFATTAQLVHASRGLLSTSSKT